MSNNNNEIDLLSILSILLGIQNLQENRDQSKHNDVQLANDKQAKFLLNEISTKFEEQNAMLKEQARLLYEVIELLKSK